MSEPRQSPIPVTNAEKKVLEEQKKMYEEQTGRNGDWGDFLTTITLLGLTAIGIYTLSQAVNRSEHTVDVTCVRCNRTFIMAVPNGVNNAIHTICPHCQTHLVVNLNT